MEIARQPDDTTCGPTCLQALYRFWNDEVPLEDLLDTVPMLAGGGTLAVLLGLHALRRGYTARLLTWNLQVFDPTWFELPREEIVARLDQRAKQHPSERIRAACQACAEFARAGGDFELTDLTPGLLRRILRRGQPILTGLSSTYLYGEARERGSDNAPDDVLGDPAGHFVLLAGYTPKVQRVHVVDPLHPGAPEDRGHYPVRIERLVGAIYLGALTHDANLLLLRPKRSRLRS